ncbi:MAG: hypothetical protein LH605_12025 [Microbacteriaceae bacterium]|nr:hypothetical protein [Microbacteriaceae bacterium]
MHTCTRLVLLNRTVIADGTAEELSDPDIWMRTFDIGANSPLLQVLGVR